METEVLKKSRGESDVRRLWTKQSGDKGSYREFTSRGACSPEVTDFTKVGDSRGSPEDQ